VTLCRRYCHTDPLVVGEKGVTLGPKHWWTGRRKSGADRLVNTIAAHDRYKGPLIVVDFGTATTFDVVDRDGNYGGGVIAPPGSTCHCMRWKWRRRSSRAFVSGAPSGLSARTR